jgi:hypothetical protein
MSYLIEPGFVVQAYRVDNERISIPPANGVAHPGKIQILGMLSPIHVNVADEVVVLEEH